jgi:hypothetical protein
MPTEKCKICGKNFYAKLSHIKKGWAKYCSQTCQYKGYRTGKFVKCDTCGKEIYRTQKELNCSKSKKFFCNKSHQTLWRNRIFIGPLHPNWKGGENIEHKNLLVRNGIKSVCKICGCRDKRVFAVHHLDRNKKNNSINNLVWLCHNCHHLVHHYKVSVFK